MSSIIPFKFRASDLCQVLSLMCRAGRLLGLDQLQVLLTDQPGPCCLFLLPGQVSFRILVGQPDLAQADLEPAEPDSRWLQLSLKRVAVYLRNLEKLAPETWITFQRISPSQVQLRWPGGYYTLSTTAAAPPAPGRGLMAVSGPSVTFPVCPWTRLLLPSDDPDRVGPILVRPPWLLSWTDRHRILAVRVEEPVPDPFNGLLLPGPFAQLASQLPGPGQLTVTADSRLVQFSGRLGPQMPYLLQSPQLNQAPPDPTVVFRHPTNSTLAVDRPALVQALTRVHAVQEPGRADVQLMTVPDQVPAQTLLVRAAGRQDGYSEALDCVPCHGDPLRAVVHLEWLLHALSQVPTGLVRLRWSQQPRPTGHLGEPEVHHFGFDELDFSCRLATRQVSQLDPLESDQAPSASSSPASLTDHTPSSP